MDIPGPAGVSTSALLSNSCQILAEEEPTENILSLTNSWKQLCDDIEIACVSNLRDHGIWNIGEVLNGECDLRVPKLMGIVGACIYYPSGLWSLTLYDSSGTILAFTKHSTVKLHKSLLTVGSTVLLQEVAVVVSKDSWYKRSLNICNRNIIAVYPDGVELCKSQQQISVCSHLSLAHSTRNHAATSVNSLFTDDGEAEEERSTFPGHSAACDDFAIANATSSSSRASFFSEPSAGFRKRFSLSELTDSTDKRRNYSWTSFTSQRDDADLDFRSQYSMTETGDPAKSHSSAHARLPRSVD